MKQDAGWKGCQAGLQEGSTMLQQSNSGTRVHSTTQFMGSVEKESFLSRRREELTKSRIAEVRKQEAQATKSSVSKLKEQQALLAEEERLLEEYRVYQQKQREKERLEKEREEVLKAWRDSQERARLEAQRDAQAREELEKRNRELQERQKHRSRAALDREEEVKRDREREEWTKKETRDKIAKAEATRTEVAIKEARIREEKRKAEADAQRQAADDELTRMRGDVLNGYGAQRKRFGMKEFENSNSRIGQPGKPLVVQEEDEEQEDAAALAAQAATEHRFELEMRRQRDAVSRERAKSREKAAHEKEITQKESQDLEKRSQAEKIKIEQSKVLMAREGELTRLAGMKQREEETREEDKRQRRLEMEFESLFFGVSRTVGDEYLGEKIAHQAYWKDPCEIHYETKKTRDWGPKNKKRDLSIPDIDRLVAERRASRERSQGSREQSGGSRSRSPQQFSGFPGDRHTLRSRSGNEKDEEVSFHCTEIESEYGREQSYAKQRLLEKYTGRDPRDSLEMTLSEDQSVMPRGSGFGGLTNDMSRFLEEQERMIQRLERDRAELNKQIQLQETASQVRPRLSEPPRMAGGHYEDEDEDAEEEQELSGRVLYSQDLARQPWMHMQDAANHNSDEDQQDIEPQPEDEEILGKFLTFQPDSKCKLRF